MVENRLSNIILIGMSGAGKSTIGKFLAEVMNKAFIDTDLLIQQKAGKLLNEILETFGSVKFLEMEDNVIRSLDTTDTVVATGGSIIYCPYAIDHLKNAGFFVYLDIPYEEIVGRISAGNGRGIVGLKEGSLKRLYDDRKPKYQELADFTVECSNKSVSEIVGAITSRCDKALNAPILK